jgi:hypothetical protein
MTSITPTTSIKGVLQMASGAALVLMLLLPPLAHGQFTPGEESPLAPHDDCEHRRDDECHPVGTVLGIVIAEYLPQLTDGARFGYGRAPGGSAYTGRLEWTLTRSQGRRLSLGAGAWIAPRKMLHPTAPGRAVQPVGRDGAFSLTLGGSLPLQDLGMPAAASFRGVAEATVLVGDPSRQLRLSLGPRYRVPVGPEALAIDLVVGANVSARAIAPRVGLRVGGLWD